MKSSSCSLLVVVIGDVFVDDAFRVRQGCLVLDLTCLQQKMRLPLSISFDMYDSL